eukprot:maker-scaffold83_size396513-snap-gene-2.33 protein:Tk00972 transcript:maker-scaffold83_size396513-snap-gene-2.33-mRNA-1 annotation:"protein tincar isoform x3"
MSDDCDDLPPPPGHSDGRMLSSPRPGQTQVHIHTQRKTPSMLHNPEIQDVQTPRSNRSVDSGLPHDDITPRSESLSTGSSSASPPDQHHNGLNQCMTQREIQQQHRKSTSLDDINVTSNGAERVPSQTQWKSGSLQRGIGPPGGTAVPPPQVPNIPNTGIYGT